MGLSGSAGRTGRTAHHLRANAGVLFWLIALLGVSLGHRFVPVATWLLIHLLLLGAVSNAILVWSAHFADAVLRSTTGRRGRWGQGARLVALNIGVASVVAGMIAGLSGAVLAGGIVVGATALWHGTALVLRCRRALPSRFRPTVRYYVVAAGFLSLGAVAGILLDRHVDHDRLVIAHVAVNVLGWVGLTVTGTLVTLWPTILHTRVVDGAERAALRALPLLAVSVAVIALAALVGPPATAIAGAAGYLGGLAIAGVPLIRETRDRPPTGYAAYSVLAGCGWLAVSLVWLATMCGLSGTWAGVAAGLGLLTGPLAAGFAAQVLLGALSYLIPVVLGGGPTAVRQATAALDRGAALRVTLINTGLLVWVLPVPSLVAVASSGLVLIGLAAFLPLLAQALLASWRARRSAEPAPPLPVRREQAAAAAAARARTGRFSGPAVIAGAVVLLAVAGAVALDPAATGAAPTASAAQGAAATGHTTTVQVTANHLRFSPATIDVPAGDRLVITVRNADTMVHDLVLDTGASSGRLAPGQQATLDVGVVGRDISGWCSIVGHRQLGMVMQIRVTGTHAMDGMPGMAAGTGTAGTGAAGTGATGDSASATTGSASTPTGSAPGAAGLLDFMADPPPGFVAHDPTLPPIGPGTVHHVTLTVTEVDREVAPGVRQTLWTYNGSMPGPTLHGRVGDTFVVHLVNDGTMGHSVDFHAGEVAPDLPMRTINPGQSLDYTFTATRSGIWLYHCSTMPMSAHIANGMFGAVVIDPPDLPPVDTQYVLISSELYLGQQDGTVDVDKVAAMRPDAVVFNGYANQYDHRPLPVTAGRRVRLWILDAGPNEPLSFHVVGGQFDTVFSEGAYLLRPGSSTAGGSQVLSLAPGQGGFVELSLPEAGNYPFVSHVMSNAERGEHGILRATGP
jgi:nitrite reductase (NO-forming)